MRDSQVTQAVSALALVTTLSVDLLGFEIAAGPLLATSASRASADVLDLNSIKPVNVGPVKALV